MNKLEKTVSIATLVQGVLKLGVFYFLFKGNILLKSKVYNRAFQFFYLWIQLLKIVLQIVFWLGTSDSGPNDPVTLTPNDVTLISSISGALWIVGFIMRIFLVLEEQMERKQAELEQLLEQRKQAELQQLKRLLEQQKNGGVTRKIGTIGKPLEA